jgi:hypothetical protein
MVLIYGSSLEALTSGISKYNALKIVHDDEPSCESASTIVGILGLMPDIRSLTITSAPSQSSQALVIGPSFVQSHSSHLLFTSSPWDLYLPLLRMETLRLGTTVQSDALLLRSHHLRHLTIGEALSQPRVEALLKAIRLHDMKTLDIRLQAPLSEALLLHSVARYTSGLKRLSIRSPPYEIRSNGELVSRYCRSLPIKR